MFRGFCSLLLLGGFAGFAHAEDLPSAPEALRSPIYVCHLTGQLTGQSVAIIIGGESISGPGNVHCTHNVTHKQVRVPVTIKMSGVGVGLDLTQISRVDLITAGITTNDPANFLDSFAIGVTGGASLIAARISFDVAVRANRNDGAGFEWFSRRGHSRPWCQPLCHDLRDSARLVNPFQGGPIGSRSKEGALRPLLLNQLFQLVRGSLSTRGSTGDLLLPSFRLDRRRRRTSDRSHVRSTSSQGVSCHSGNCLILMTFQAEVNRVILVAAQIERRSLRSREHQIIDALHRTVVEEQRREAQIPLRGRAL